MHNFKAPDIQHSSNGQAGTAVNFCWLVDHKKQEFKYFAEIYQCLTDTQILFNRHLLGLYAINMFPVKPQKERTLKDALKHKFPKRFSILSKC